MRRLRNGLKCEMSGPVNQDSMGVAKWPARRKRVSYCGVWLDTCVQFSLCFAPAPGMVLSTPGLLDFDLNMCACDAVSFWAQHTNTVVVVVVRESQEGNKGKETKNDEGKVDKTTPPVDPSHSSCRGGKHNSSSSISTQCRRLKRPCMC